MLSCRFSSQWRSSRNSCLAAAFSPGRSTPSGSNWHLSQKSALAATSSHSTKKPAQWCSSHAKATDVAQLELSISSCASSSPCGSASSHMSVSEPRPLSACGCPPITSKEPFSEVQDCGRTLRGSLKYVWPELTWGGRVVLWSSSL